MINRMFATSQNELTRRAFSSSFYSCSILREKVISLPLFHRQHLLWMVFAPVHISFGVPVRPPAAPAIPVEELYFWPCPPLLFYPDRNLNPPQNIRICQRLRVAWRSFLVVLLLFDGCHGLCNSEKNV